MSIAVQHKRGTLANRPSLASGEIYYATDTNQVFIGPTPTLIADGGLLNESTADQQISAATTALLTGSLISVPAGKLRVGTVIRFTLTLSKTAAGTAANTFNFRLGTAGTTSDASICAFALPVGTAVADVGKIEVVITIRGPLSSSCVAQGSLSLIHNLSATGLAGIPCVCINTLSGTFDATVANLKASLSCTTAASTVLTFQQVIASTMNLS
jgi:hypothetical protein